ncbi:7967_t:CDS:1, partial [Diversispora eburnea]
MSESSSENNSSPSHPKRKRKAISRNKVRRKFSSIWNYFIAGKIVGGGHYEAICKFCNKNWKHGIPKKMVAHICNECTKVHASIRKTVLTKFVKKYNSIPTNETEEEIKIPKLSSSTSNIQEFFENVNLPEGRKKEIN